MDTTKSPPYFIFSSNLWCTKLKKRSVVTFVSLCFWSEHKIKMDHIDFPNAHLWSYCAQFMYVISKPTSSFIKVATQSTSETVFLFIWSPSHFSESNQFPKVSYYSFSMNILCHLETWQITEVKWFVNRFMLTSPFYE